MTLREKIKNDAVFGITFIAMVVLGISVAILPLVLVALFEAASDRESELPPNQVNQSTVKYEISVSDSDQPLSSDGTLLMKSIFSRKALVHMNESLNMMNDDLEKDMPEIIYVRVTLPEDMFSSSQYPGLNELQEHNEKGE